MGELKICIFFCFICNHALVLTSENSDNVRLLKLSYGFHLSKLTADVLKIIVETVYQALDKHG